MKTCRSFFGQFRGKCADLLQWKLLIIFYSIGTPGLWVDWVLWDNHIWNVQFWFYERSTATIRLRHQIYGSKSLRAWPRFHVPISFQDAMH